MVTIEDSAPHVSLIVSAYRSEQYLTQFRKGVTRFAQELRSFPELRVELILVLNDPSDVELKFADRLPSLCDGQLQVTCCVVPRETLYASWNRGVQVSRGRAIGFWNVDDERYASAVAEGFALLSDGAQLVYYSYISDLQWSTCGVMARRKRILRPALHFDPCLFRRAMLIGPFFLISRSLWQKVGPFDEQFRIVGDWDWCIRALSAVDFTKGSQIAGVFLDSAQGLSTVPSRLRTVERELVLARHGLSQGVITADTGQHDIEGIIAQAYKEVRITRIRALQDILDSHPRRDPLRALAAKSVRVYRSECARSAAAELRATMERGLLAGDLSGIRRTYLRCRHGYASRARYFLLLPIVMLSPRALAALLQTRQRR